MAPNLSEDEIDDLLYFARVGEKHDFEALANELGHRERCTFAKILESARDETSGNGVLHMAAANGHDKFLEFLLDALSKPSPQNSIMLSILNTQNKSGNTALHWAALNGHLESVKKLIGNGADPTIKNQKGHDAVYESELNDKKEVVEWVLREGGEGLEEGLGGDTVEGDGFDTVEADEEEAMKTENDSTKLEDTMDELEIEEGSPSART